MKKLGPNIEPLLPLLKIGFAMSISKNYFEILSASHFRPYTTIISYLILTPHGPSLWINKRDDPIDHPSLLTKDHFDQ
jgi:hypothetical protein